MGIIKNGGKGLVFCASATGGAVELWDGEGHDATSRLALGVDRLDDERLRKLEEDLRDLRVTPAAHSREARERADETYAAEQILEQSLDTRYMGVSGFSFLRWFLPASAAEAVLLLASRVEARFALSDLSQMVEWRAETRTRAGEAESKGEDAFEPPPMNPSWDDRAILLASLRLDLPPRVAAAVGQDSLLFVYPSAEAAGELYTGEDDDAWKDNHRGLFVPRPSEEEGAPGLGRVKALAEASERWLLSTESSELPGVEKARQALQSLFPRLDPPEEEEEEEAPPAAAGAGGDAAVVEISRPSLAVPSATLSAENKHHHAAFGLAMAVLNIREQIARSAVLSANVARQRREGSGGEGEGERGETETVGNRALLEAYSFRTWWENAQHGFRNIFGRAPVFEKGEALATCWDTSQRAPQLLLCARLVPSSWEPTALARKFRKVASFEGSLVFSYWVGGVESGTAREPPSSIAVAPLRSVSGGARWCPWSSLGLEYPVNPEEEYGAFLEAFKKREMDFDFRRQCEEVPLMWTESLALRGSIWRRTVTRCLKAPWRSPGGVIHEGMAEFAAAISPPCSAMGSPYSIDREPVSVQLTLILHALTTAVGTRLPHSLLGGGEGRRAGD